MKKSINRYLRLFGCLQVFLFIFCLSSTVSAATFTVTKIADTNDGICDADCSLREAINSANLSVSDDVINFASNIFGTPQTITLGGTELTVANNGKLTINGNDSNLITISANTQSRVFNINIGAVATINKLKITGGFENQAGGIINRGVLVITDSRIDNNKAVFIGGGVYNADINAVLTVINSVFINNIANDYDGGGILNDGKLNISNSTLSNNSAGSNGGGIATRGGSTEIANSDIVNNRAYTGGGISNYEQSSGLTIRNSLVANNSASSFGCGINTQAGPLDVINTTVTSNIGNAIGGGGILVSSGSVANLANATVVNNKVNAVMGSGGGVQNSGTVNSRNSIIAKNSAGLYGADFRGTLNSQGYNLIGNIDNTVIVGNTTGNIIGQDPQIAALTDNGGRTQTHALLPGSPAIDAGDPVNFESFDQRGAARPLDGDSNGSALPDIGAFEVGAKIVTKVADTNDSVCDADCSLREAITVANNSAANDAIIFSSLFNSPQTITLSNGELVVANNGTLTISGTSLNLLTISGNNSSRVLYFKEFVTATISDLRIIQGNGVGTFVVDLGGGIYSAANSHITLNNLIISNNSSAGGGGLCNDNGNVNINASTFLNNFASFGQGGGGGISNLRGGLMTINNSLIMNNSSTGTGGGINNNLNSTLNLNSSTVSNNSVSGSSGFGGGVSSYGVTNIINSTVNDNTASQIGGGIFTGNAAPVTITNSTITGNSTIANGGGIGNFGNNTIVTITNVTVGNNRASNGGGIYNTGTLNSRNTIIADNGTTGSGSPDFSGNLTSQGYNLVENPSGANITGITTGNILGRDPQLATFRNNGGTTQTIALLPTSPAVDAADPNNYPAIDQRGVARPQDGDLNGSALPDIGAYERQVTVFPATNLNDTNDGICDANCSLREAIAAANMATSPDNAVVFSPGLFTTPRNITLTGGELSITNPNTTFLINGPGANLLTISGNNQSRVFYFGINTNAVLSGVTIAGGNGIGAVNNGFGGGIYNNGGTLIVANSIVSGNRSPNGNGGGIRNDNGGILSFNKSTLRNNIANGDGGGIFNFGTGSIVNVTESTINNNSASSGAGIYNFSLLNLSNSTISSNSANLFGGGVFTDGLFGGVSNISSATISSNAAGTSGGGGYNASGMINVRNTIFADNSAANSAPDFFGNFTSQGYNLVENSTETTITGTTTGNILGQDPKLSSLGNFGGATQTQTLQPNSPAIDKGNSFGLSTDQRGQIRPYDFPNIANASGGNGADIGAFERQANEVSGITLFDFDGDGRSDISVFRPSTGAWYLLNSLTGFTASAFGQSGDKIVPADYDGDGKTDLAVFRNGNWYIQRSRDGFFALQFGNSSHIPAPSDFTGDGKTDIAVFVPANGAWYVNDMATGQTSVFQFGQNGDLPVAADYDGDGRADYAVFRTNIWYIQRSTSGFTGIQFGQSGDLAVPADYDGDGKTDVAVFRPANGAWYVNGSTGRFSGVVFGQSGDLPTPADYDGDGRADISVYRTNTWYLNRSTQGFTGIQFGSSGDLPAPNAFVR